MHLHEAVKRGAGRFEKELQVEENDMRFARQGAVKAVASFGIDRQHPRAEYQASGADSWDW